MSTKAPAGLPEEAEETPKVLYFLIGVSVLSLVVLVGYLIAGAL